LTFAGFSVFVRLGVDAFLALGILLFFDWTVTVGLVFFSDMLHLLR
jgi:hypothetical protein